MTNQPHPRKQHHYRVRLTNMFGEIKSILVKSPSPEEAKTFALNEIGTFDWWVVEVKQRYRVVLITTHVFNGTVLAFTGFRTYDIDKLLNKMDASFASYNEEITHYVIEG